MQLVSKISNLCDPDPPTSQTDWQTTCNRKTALCSCTIEHKDLALNIYKFFDSAPRGKNGNITANENKTKLKPKLGN